MAASSLTDVMEAVVAQQPDVTPVIAGSSTLAAQLRAQADADVLITADTATMQRAVSDGSVQGEPVVIATNALVLATAHGNPGAVTGLDDLADADLVVGLCDTDVPCGTLARSALEAAGVEPAVDTLELSVRALATKLSLGELDAGLIYRTDAASAGLPVVDAPELAGHHNRYFIAAVAAAPPVRVRHVVDAFVDPDGFGTKTLAALGFDPP